MNLRNEGNRLRWRGALRLAAVLALFVPVAAQAVKSKKPTNASVLPLIIRGDQVPGMPGTRINAVSVFACNGGKLLPIRSQLDEINEEGRVVSRFGQSARVKPDATPGLIDADDELVMMLADLGEQCLPENLEKITIKPVELKVELSHLREPAYAYVVLGEEFPSPKSLVSYEPGKDAVRTAAYLWGFDPANPFMLTSMQLGDLTGTKPENILDRTKARFKVRALGQMMALNFSEEDIESELLGVQMGPVRVVRELDMRVNFIPGFNPEIRATYFLYDRYVGFVVHFKLPGQAAVFLSSLEMRAGWDFADLSGLRFSTKGLPQGALIDGRTVPGEEVIPFGNESWYMLSGRGVNFVTGIDWPREIKVEPQAFFIDDTKASNPPERVPGSMPMVGYVLNGWEGLSAKWYAVDGTLGILPGFPEGGGSGFYEVVREKPKITATPPVAPPVPATP